MLLVPPVREPLCVFCDEDVCEVELMVDISIYPFLPYLAH
jgi:hypothetical protein